MSKRPRWVDTETAAIDWNENTGVWQCIWLSNAVLICRPARKRCIAVLHHMATGAQAQLVRHLIVRRRSLAGYSPAIVAAVAEDEGLMNAVVEFRKPGWRRTPRLKTVRLLMAERGLHGTVTGDARIQIQMGRWHRVWATPPGENRRRPVASFAARFEAVAERDRRNVT